LGAEDEENFDQYILTVEKFYFSVGVKMAPCLRVRVCYLELIDEWVGKSPAA
jgi:hypothetical protein